MDRVEQERLFWQKIFKGKKVVETDVRYLTAHKHVHRTEQQLRKDFERQTDVPHVSDEMFEAYFRSREARYSLRGAFHREKIYGGIDELFDIENG